MLNRYLPWGAAVLSLLILAACGSDRIELKLNPELQTPYAYRMAHDTKRSVQGVEESANNAYVFDLVFVSGQDNSFGVKVKVHEAGLEDQEKMDEYEATEHMIRRALLADTTDYTMNRGGGMVFGDTVDMDYFEQMNMLSGIDNDSVYQDKIKEIMLREIRKSMFSEWVDYLPAGKVKKGDSWETTNTLNFLNILSKGRTFKWTLLADKGDQAELEGVNKITELSGSFDVGMGIQVKITFEGKMESVYKLVVDKKTGLIVSGEINVETDGEFSRVPVGLPEGAIETPGKERLQGSMHSVISRI